jgi:hypothetical protein
MCAAQIVGARPPARRCCLSRSSVRPGAGFSNWTAANDRG